MRTLETCYQAVRVGRYVEITDGREANERFFYGWMRRADSVK